MLVGASERPGILRKKFFGASVRAGSRGPSAAAILRFRLGRQAVSPALQIIGGELHSLGVLSTLVRQIAPFGLGNAFLFAQPVAVLGGFVPGDADNWTIGFRSTAVKLTVRELRVKALELCDGDVVSGNRKAPANATGVEYFVEVAIRLGLMGAHLKLDGTRNVDHCLALRVDPPRGGLLTFRSRFLP